MDGEASAANAAPSISIDRVVQLLVGPNSDDLALRHTISIKHLCRSNAKGFYVRDLEKLCTVMDITASAIKQGQATFEEPMQLILRHASGEQYSHILAWRSN
jgi:hypothetical protein